MRFAFVSTLEYRGWLLRHSYNLSGDFRLVGELPRLQLGIDEFVIDREFKAPTTGRLEFET